MKASEVYQHYQAEIDQLQEKLKDLKNEQHIVQQCLENKQKKTKTIMDLVIKDGDHELTEEEITEIGV